MWWSQGHIGIPQETPTQHLLAIVNPGRSCGFEVSFRVPAASPGPYLITVLAYFQGGFGIMGERKFVVTG